MTKNNILISFNKKTICNENNFSETKKCSDMNDIVLHLCESL